MEQHPGEKSIVVGSRPLKDPAVNNGSGSVVFGGDEVAAGVDARADVVGADVVGVEVGGRAEVPVEVAGETEVDGEVGDEAGAEAAVER